MDINSIISKNIDGYLKPKYAIYKIYYIACYRCECDEMTTVRKSKIVEIIPKLNWDCNIDCFENDRLLKDELEFLYKDGVTEVSSTDIDKEKFHTYTVEELKYIIYKAERLS